MIELLGQELKDELRQSSKGNQLKWENNGVWYKADYTGYEGLSEYVISALLQLSTLEKNEYVLYDPIQMKYKEVIYRGVSCDNFLKDDWQIITLERLFRNLYGESFHSAIYKMNGIKDRLEFLVGQVEKATGLKDFGKYMNKLFTIDALFLNEDRHMHNVAVLMNGKGEFEYCPIFDNGAGLLADTTMDYPMSGNVGDMIGGVKARTISTEFDEQLDASEQLYGCNIKFYFNRDDLAVIVNKATIYAQAERKRVEEIITLHRLRNPKVMQGILYYYLNSTGS